MPSFIIGITLILTEKWGAICCFSFAKTYIPNALENTALSIYLLGRGALLRHQKPLNTEDFWALKAFGR